MVVEFSLGMNLFKTAFDTIKGFSELKNDAEKSAALLDLQRAFLDAQQQQMSMSNQIKEFESQIAEFNIWETEKNRYVLKEFLPGSFAMTIKDHCRSDEPEHSLCPTCFEKKKKVVLQGGTTGYGTRIIKCPECDTQINHSEGPEYLPGV